MCFLKSPAADDIEKIGVTSRCALMMGNVGHMDKRLLLNLPPHDVAHQCIAAAQWDEIIFSTLQ